MILLSKNVRYDSRSGYKFLDTLSNIRSGTHIAIPPIEKQLWSKLWQSKTYPKLRHFLWRVMNGALAVKLQLVSRGIPVEAVCPVCHQGPETVCHMLFQCPLARDTWELSQFPTPPAGWSSNSVFLNIHHLIVCSQKQNIGVLLRLSFPWLLWHIWKARNKFCFEQVQPIALEVVRKAREEATVWLNLHGYLPECLNTSAIDPESTEVWSKPQGLSLKCSIGASWNGSSSVSGASWIIWNSRGKV